MGFPGVHVRGSKEDRREKPTAREVCFTRVTGVLNRNGLTIPIKRQMLKQDPAARCLPDVPLRVRAIESVRAEGQGKVRGAGHTAESRSGLPIPSNIWVKTGNIIGDKEGV